MNRLTFLLLSAAISACGGDLEDAPPDLPDGGDSATPDKKPDSGHDSESEDPYREPPEPDYSTPPGPSCYCPAKTDVVVAGLCLRATRTCSSERRCPVNYACVAKESDGTGMCVCGRPECAPVCEFLLDPNPTDPETPGL